MIRIITGGFFSGSRSIIQARLKKEVFEEKKYRRAFYVVPEQQTLSSERDLCELLPTNHPLFVEATNFTRLANTVFRELGGLAQAEADSLRRALLIYKAISNKSGQLSSMKRGGVTSGAVDKMISAIRKMQTLSISASELREVSAGLSADGESARLCEKLIDLSVIMTEYSRLLELAYKSADDTLTKLHSKLAEGGERVFSGAKVYIEGFTSFTEPQYRVIADIARLCDVDVVLTLPSGARDAFEYTEVRDTYSRLARLGARCDVPTKSERLDDGSGPVPLLQHICDNLWRSNANFDKYALQDDEDLRIFEAENPYEECDFVAADIKRRIMDGKRRYSDFAILARDIGSYRGILSVAFEKAGIPLFISEEDRISSFEITRLISSALAAISSGYSRNDVMTYAKCSLSPLTDGEADELEAYVHRWQLDKSAFTDSDDWAMSPFGFDSGRRHGWRERVDRINDSRRRLIEPLLMLEEQFKRDGSILSRTTALYNFLTSELCVHEKLCAHARWLKAHGRCEEARDTERIYAMIISTLDAVVEVLGEVTVDNREYIGVLELALSQTRFGSIPSFTDQVVAGSLDGARFKSKPCVYIIGANQGVLPARVSDDGYFLENELKAISNKINPDSDKQDEDSSELKRRSAMEYFYISRAISICGESLTLLYPLASASFGTLAKSDVISRISTVTGGTVSPVSLSSLPALLRIYTKHYALEHHRDNDEVSDEIRLALEGAGMGELICRADSSVDNAQARLSDDTVRKIYGQRIVISPSGLESYHSCPMRHFLSRKLSLDDGERAKIGANGIGSFIHAVLEGFFRDLKHSGTAPDALTDAERERLTRAAAVKYTQSAFPTLPVNSKRTELLIERLTRAALPIVESLCDELSGCKYTPTFFELKISSKEGASCGKQPSGALFRTRSGHEIYVVGEIDRVDTFIHEGDAYVRVVDYKTGKKEFSPNDLKAGENLQMFLYLKALVETDSPEFKQELGVLPGARLIPAGVIYAKTDMSELRVSVGESAYDAAKSASSGRLGMLLDDTVSIGAMNPDYIPVRLTGKSRDKIHGGDMHKLYTEDTSREDILGWQTDILGCLDDAVGELGESILSGDISAKPQRAKGKSTACEYCSFKPVCRNAK